MRISDWSSDVCSSDLAAGRNGAVRRLIDHGRDVDAVRVERRKRRRRHDAGNPATWFRPRLPVPVDHADRIQQAAPRQRRLRSEEHTSELQSLMRISYAVFCLKKNIKKQHK